MTPDSPFGGPLSSERRRELAEASWARAHGYDIRAARIALAKIGSKAAIRSWQEYKLAVRFAPPTAARGPFPFPHRSLDQVPRSGSWDR